MHKNRPILLYLNQSHYIWKLRKVKQLIHGTKVDLYKKKLSVPGMTQVFEHLKC